MKSAFFLCCLSFMLVQTCRCANIVVYMPQPYYSHMMAFKPLWLELAKRGHKLTLIQPTLIGENNENITHVLLDKTHEIMDRFKVMEKMVKGGSILQTLSGALTVAYELLEYQLTHPGVQEFLNGEKKVDLFFAEYITPYGSFLGQKLGVPIIGVVSMDAVFNDHMSMGNPTHPVMYPDKSTKYVVPLTFLERVGSTLIWVCFQIGINYVLNPLMRIGVAKHLGDLPPTEDIIKNVSLLFTNANPLFNVVRPLGPKTINIGGGAQLLEPQPLPGDLQDYLDSAKNGAIYFSLGTVVSSKLLLNTTKEMFVETFSQLPYKVLWKSEEKIPGIPNNVKMVKWAPQQDVLRHKNVKLFITHGGLQSVEEGLLSHVPMLVLPFYADQHGNARRIEVLGLGLNLEHTELTTNTLKSAILKILDNPRYKERTKELADLVMDQPMTGLEKAVWWTEYVLRHGHTDHFRDPSVDTPWYQFFLLDVISFLLVTTTAVIYVLVKIFQSLKWLICKLYRLLTKQNKKTKTS